MEAAVVGWGRWRWRRRRGDPRGPETRPSGLVSRASTPGRNRAKVGVGCPGTRVPKRRSGRGAASNEVLQRLDWTLQNIGLRAMETSVVDDRKVRSDAKVRCVAQKTEVDVGRTEVGTSRPGNGRNNVIRGNRVQAGDSKDDPPSVKAIPHEDPGDKPQKELKGSAFVIEGVVQLEHALTSKRPQRCTTSTDEVPQGLKLGLRSEVIDGRSVRVEGCVKSTPDADHLGGRAGACTNSLPARSRVSRRATETQAHLSRKHIPGAVYECGHGDTIRPRKERAGGSARGGTRNLKKL